jgi:hypothetical protein
MKLGVPIYDNFVADVAESGRGHIDSNVCQRSNDISYLLVNSNNQVTTAILAQRQAGRLVVLWDAIADGDPGTVLTDLIQSALLSACVTTRTSESPQTTSLRGVSRSNRSLEAQPPLRLLSSPRHFDEYTIYGLRAACRKAGYELERGGETAQGREEIRALLRRVSHGGSAIAVGGDASWTLRAFAGGYARDAASALPIDNAYAVLMEPLEAFAARTRLAVDPLASQPNYAYTSDGRRYVSALVSR